MQKNFSTLIKHALTVLWASLLATNAAFGWGPEGHRAVAMIAAKNLTPEVRSKVQVLLGPHNTLAAVSTWADDIREEHPETGPWHYIDIPLAAPSLDMNRDCKDGNCIVAKIEEFESALKNKSADPAVRREALKFMVHFVADLHQPLHCADNNDKGGNTVQVIFLGQPMNLHAVWDSGIIKREKLWGIRLADDLESRISPAERTAWVRGTPKDWAMEGHALAAQVAYGKLPHLNTKVPANLDDDNFNATLPVAEQQVQKAGIRLAFLLNRALQ